MPKFLTFHKADGDSKLEGITVEIFPVKYAYGKWKRDNYCPDISHCTWGYYHPATGEIETLLRSYTLDHYGIVETRKRGSWGRHARHRTPGRGIPRYNPKRFRHNNFGSNRPKSRPVEDIFFESYEDANLVLCELRGMIKDYGWATVADLMTLVGLPRNFTDEQYGWTSLDATGIGPVNDDYVITFPDALYRI